MARNSKSKRYYLARVGAASLVSTPRIAEPGCRHYCMRLLEEELSNVVARGGMDRWLRQLALRASVGAVRLG